METAWGRTPGWQDATSHSATRTRRTRAPCTFLSSRRALVAQPTGAIYARCKRPWMPRLSNVCHRALTVYHAHGCADSVAIDLTRALTCVSKFSDDLIIIAGVDNLTLCATNTSLSAYCCFKYDAQFFTRYRVTGGGDDHLADAVTSSGQVLVKVRSNLNTAI